MKSKNLKLASFFLMSIILVSCESDDQSETMPRFDSLDVISAQAFVGEGEWLVTEFRDDDDLDDDDSYDTIDFEGYVFEFNGDGSVTATLGDSVFTGAWRIELEDDSDDDDDDDDSGEMEFYLEFNASNDILEEISDDWEILEYSDTRIRLGDDDDLDDDDELLVFERN